MKPPNSHSSYEEIQAYRAWCIQQSDEKRAISKEAMRWLLNEILTDTTPALAMRRLYGMALALEVPAVRELSQSQLARLLEVPRQRIFESVTSSTKNLNKHGYCSTSTVTK